MLHVKRIALYSVNIHMYMYIYITVDTLFFFTHGTAICGKRKKPNRYVIYTYTHSHTDVT